VLDRHAKDTRRVALVDRGQQDKHHRRTRIHVPIRHGPFDLLAVLELVGPAIALVVALLARPDHNEDRRSADPRLSALAHRRRLVEELRDAFATLRLGDDQQAMSLAEASAGCT